MSKVGAEILNIITGSLYDRPLVVFREYVQNSVDSFTNTIKQNADIKEKLYCSIFVDGNDLFFLDNGEGICDEGEFRKKMTDIGNSSKSRMNNIGYKGIGRFSGITYCERICFISIVDWEKQEFFGCNVDANRYREIKGTAEREEWDINQLLETIETFNIDEKLNAKVADVLKKYKSEDFPLNKGFLVILERVLPSFIMMIKNENDIVEQLKWLLPIPFENNLLKSNQLAEYKDKYFDELSKISFKIKFNDILLTRPIDVGMFRGLECVREFSSYGFGFFTVNGYGIAIDNKNKFAGVKIYIDNVLLCDEVELVHNLIGNGHTTHTANELVQTLRGVGCMIYIQDKKNILANARRTFFEITDVQSVELLELLRDFVHEIYEARYAISKYINYRNRVEVKEGRLDELKQRALKSLRMLLRDDDTDIVAETIRSFSELSQDEQLKLIKKEINSGLAKKVKEYLTIIESKGKIDFSLVFESFLQWLKEQKNEA